MFCYQCEQSAKGIGCESMGVCGKTPEVSGLHDVLEHELRGLALYARAARDKAIINKEVNSFTIDALFTTLTNVNFDPENVTGLIQKCIDLRALLEEKVSVDVPASATFMSTASDSAALDAMASKCGINSLHKDEDIRSLMHTVLYGLKGVAAYAVHARTFGQEDDSVYAYIHEALASMLDESLSLNDWVALALKCGEVNLKVMKLLDAGNTGTYGHPEPTEVSLGHKKGKAILVSGHDLKDLQLVLEQTEGKGINVYTHGEMLPCHGYPELKKYSHLAGHYGTAWQNQKKEFAEFPGAILMTTNCIQKPQELYAESIFTSGPVQWPGIPHFDDHDFSALVEKALELPGFDEDVSGKTVLTGFARNAVLGVADKIVEGVKNKDIRHFFLVAGCDGVKSERSYYEEFVEKVPSDCIVLTLACGKFRFFDKEMGDIGGIPRLLDVGQCNDAYSAIKIAVALSEAFGVGVNDLPLSIVLSWYEQKAVSILLSLLHLGIKDIRLGPTLPAFLTPNVLQVLVDNYALKPITTAEEDLKAILCPEGENAECLEALSV